MRTAHSRLKCVSSMMWNIMTIFSPLGFQNILSSPIHSTSRLGEGAGGLDGAQSLTPPPPHPGSKCHSSARLCWILDIAWSLCGFISKKKKKVVPLQQYHKPFLETVIFVFLKFLLNPFISGGPRCDTSSRQTVTSEPASTCVYTKRC